MLKKISMMVLGLALAAPALGETWEIDAGHSEVGFSIRHMMVSNVRGKFKTFSGTVDFDEKNLAKSMINVEIDTASIDTGVADRDKHLRAADFFDVEKHPKMFFKSTKFTKTGPDKYTVAGNLTMHGVTKPVTLLVDAPATQVKDPWGMIRRGVSATATILRKDFGLTYNKAIEAGGVVLGEEVKIQLELEFTQKVAKTS